MMQTRTVEYESVVNGNQYGGNGGVMTNTSQFEIIKEEDPNDAAMYST